MPLLFLFPWVMVLLAFGALGSNPLTGQLYPGVLLLLGGLMVSVAAGLYARAPSGPRVRLWSVVGLSCLAYTVILQAIAQMSSIDAFWLAASGWSAIAAGVSLMVALLLSFFAEPQSLPRLEGLPYRTEDGAMTQTALWALSPSIEALSRFRPVVLLLLKFPPDQTVPSILRNLRSPDLLFRLESGLYLVVLQEGGSVASQVVFKRLKDNLPLEAYSAMSFRGGSLRGKIEQLQAELDQALLTHPDMT